MSAARPPVVVVLSTDLMDRSRFAVLDGRAEVRVLRAASGVGDAVTGAEPPTLTCVDLARPDALDAIAACAAAGARVVAYGSHVERERLDAAHAAGAEVLARSAFFTRLPTLLDGDPSA